MSAADGLLYAALLAAAIGLIILGIVRLYILEDRADRARYGTPARDGCRCPKPCRVHPWRFDWMARP